MKFVAKWGHLGDKGWLTAGNVNGADCLTSYL
jgi:hypothetical protein